MEQIFPGDENPIVHFFSDTVCISIYIYLYSRWRQGYFHDNTVITQCGHLLPGYRDKDQYEYSMFHSDI